MSLKIKLVDKEHFLFSVVDENDKAVGYIDGLDPIYTALSNALDPNVSHIAIFDKGNKEYALCILVSDTSNENVQDMIKNAKKR